MSNIVKTLLESAPRPIGDRELLERFHAGDAAAFDELVERHRVAVYRVALRTLGTHEDADEAAQVTFIRAWRALDRFRGDASLRTWLIRIALNVARSMRSARRPAEPLAEGGDPVWRGAAADATVEREQSGRRIRGAVDRLPPRQREVVILKVFGEMTYREVAAILELSEGAVKAHLHQAVSNLRRALMAATEAEARS